MNHQSNVRTHERLDDLQLNGLKIIQDPQGFCFGIDAVLLSHFIDVKKAKLAVEFGTGTGIIPLLLSERKAIEKILTFEVQEKVAHMARRSIELNQLEDRIQVIHDTLHHACNYMENGSADIVFSNPPYMAPHAAIKNPSDEKAISRHEILCTLEDVVRNAAQILKFRGAFFMIHRPTRLVDIITLCRQYKLEPKKIQMIQPYKDSPPNIFMIKCVKGGNPEMKVMPPLVVYEAKGQFSNRIYEIYSEAQITSFTERQG